jgi:hypothetical protein
VAVLVRSLDGESMALQVVLSAEAEWTL